MNESIIEKAIRMSAALELLINQMPAKEYAEYLRRIKKMESSIPKTVSRRM